MFDIQLAFEIVCGAILALALPALVLVLRGGGALGARARATEARALGVVSVLWGAAWCVVAPLAGLLGWLAANGGHGIERDLGPFVVGLAALGLVGGVAVVVLGVAIGRGRGRSAARPVAIAWAALHVGASCVCFALARDSMHGTWAWMLRHDRELWMFTIVGTLLSLGGTAHAVLLDHVARR